MSLKSKTVVVLGGSSGMGRSRLDAKVAPSGAGRRARPSKRSGKVGRNLFRRCGDRGILPEREGGQHGIFNLHRCGRCRSRRQILRARPRPDSGEAGIRLGQVTLGEQTFWIMKAPPGAQGQISRDYRRHWTPVHLDFAVDDIDEAVKRAVDAGGQLEGEIQRTPKGAMANLSDPSGNGVDLVSAKK